MAKSHTTMSLGALFCCQNLVLSFFRRTFANYTFPYHRHYTDNIRDNI